jgi:hypothetical protein
MVWTGFTCAISYPILREQHRGAARHPVLLIPAVGVLLPAGAVYVLLRRRRYGVSVLQPATLPAPVGRALAGMVRTRVVRDPAGGFVARLECIRRTVTGSGKNRSTHEAVL